MISVDQTSQIQLLTRACESTRSILENVTRDQLTLPTPCNDWQVHDLINHIVGATHFFADVGEQGSSPEGQEWPSYADGDFVTSFGQWAPRAVAAFSAAGAMGRTMLLPTGAAPGSRCMQVAAEEIFVHGWDLAKATENDPPPFAPEIDVPREAPAVDRLTGFLGRDPGWSGGQ